MEVDPRGLGDAPCPIGKSEDLFNGRDSVLHNSGQEKFAAFQHGSDC